MMRPQMENPEREASMHKYALEKMKEEYERFKLEVPHSLLRMRVSLSSSNMTRTLFLRN